MYEMHECGMSNDFEWNDNYVLVAFYVYSYLT